MCKKEKGGILFLGIVLVCGGLSAQELGKANGDVRCNRDCRNSVIADFNGDGCLDVAEANVFEDRVCIALGNCDGSFSPADCYAVGRVPLCLAAGDFRGEGTIDLASANHVSGSVSVLLGNGDGTFQPAVHYPVGGNPICVDNGDFNGDGCLDLVVGYDTPRICLLLGECDGSFAPPQCFD